MKSLIWQHQNQAMRTWVLYDHVDLLKSLGFESATVAKLADSAANEIRWRVPA